MSHDELQAITDNLSLQQQPRTQDAVYWFWCTVHDGKIQQLNSTEQRHHFTITVTNLAVFFTYSTLTCNNNDDDDDNGQGRCTTASCTALSTNNTRPSLDQPSGIRFQTSSEMRLRTLFGSHWKHCFSDNISMLSALEVLYDNVLYKLTFSYLLFNKITSSFPLELNVSIRRLHKTQLHEFYINA